MELSLRFLSYLTLLCYLLHPTEAVTPVFQDYSPATITEGLPPGTFYYQFKATDSSGHAVTYSLESIALEWFNINSTTGNTTVKKTIDREVMGSLYRYKVFASDGANTAEATVNQQIRDINDNPPVFSNLPRTISINEDSLVGSLVFTVTATDADSNPANVIEYAIEGGNEEGRFEIPNAAEGKINLKKPLDYEDGTRQFVLRIIANNTLKEHYLYTTAVLTINVLDVDDLGAKFEKNLYEATVVKDSLPGAVVTTVQAKDEDSLNATVEYTIYQETNPGNAYKIDNNTGEITVNGALTIGTQMLVVTATSTKHPPAFTVVKITVASMINVSYTVNVAEEQSNVVIFNLEPAEKFYNISGGTFSIIPSSQSGLFSIDGKDLKIGATKLDRETQDQYQIHIAVDKDGTRKGMVMVTIKVLDINDNEPLFQGDLPYNASVREDADVGHSILRVTATDVDEGENATVKYAITGGERPDLFSIENATGIISLAGSLDRERTGQYTLTIQAYDGGSPPMTNTTTVIINVKDVNDNLPVLNQTSIAKTIPEWATNGTEVAVVSATDADIGDNGRITYVIQEGADDKFAIDPNSGTITTIGELSYATKPSYTLVVNARDNGSPPRSATAVVHITIRPRTNISYTEQVIENSANVEVLNLLGVDQDYRVSGATFSLISGNDDNLFLIDAANASLKVGSRPLDRELQSEYRLQIQVEKHGTTRGIAMVTVLVLDVNDNTPSFQGSMPYDASIKEDAGIGTNVFNVLATDSDSGLNGTVKYAITAGNDQGLFAIDNATGIITLAGSLDREKTAQFTLTIQAYDGGSPPMTNTTTVTINVQDVNDNSPVFNQTSISKTIPEWATNGTEVAVVSAIDADSGNNGRITYVIQEGADGKFVINSTSGFITTTGGLTTTTEPKYTLAVIAHDYGSPPRSAIALLHVTIQRRRNISYTEQVNEESANVEVLNLLNVDQDYRVSGATFSLISGNDDNLFLIDAANASLKVGSRPLDRELRSEYRLQMQVEKDGTTRGIAMVTVLVLDVNDNTPSFQESIPYDTSIKEDAGIGTNIFNVLATDSDSGLNGTVKYAITAGNDQGLFAIDNATGIITLAGSLDREKTAQFTLTIQAYDGGSPPMTNTTTVTINVQDVNDNSPVFNQTSISETIPEWATNGTEVAVVSATDADSGNNGRITYVIQEGADGKFVINSTSGVITTTGELTTTTEPKYTLVVNARDNGSPPRSATAVVHITIQRRTNISYTVQVNEESANVEVLNLLNVDQDYRVSGATFSLISGNEENLFLIDDANASLKVGSRPLDRELRSEYRLQMQVEKDGTTRGIAMVTVLVLDVNDNTPSFQGSIPYDTSIKEDAGIGTSVLNILATDNDSGLNGTVKYAITAGNQHGLFAIDNATGIITLAGSLDRKQTAQFTLTIQAYDGGSPPMTNTTTVTINVQDVNDNSPVFNQTSISETIPEWATNGTEVTAVSATDADSGDNGRITYFIQEGADGKFVINSTNGVITTTGGLTATTEPKYTLVVNARDNGSPPRSATAVVHITIQRRTNISYTEQVTEESANVEVLNLLDVDQDYRVSGATFSLISGNDDSLFLIDTANKSLKVGSRPLDRELRSEYRLQMQVEKDGITRGMAMVTVQILDVNDNSPSFQGSVPYDASIKEDAGIGTNVFNVLAKDSDSGLNGTVKYAITAGNDQGLFAIDNATGIITLAGSLDREKTSQFTLTIQAYDGGSPPMTNTTTVTINVQDVNDNSPVLNKTSISKTIPEWATIGTEVTAVSATDADSGDNGRITYVIQEGADSKFVINSTSGVITTTGGLTTTPKSRYTLAVIAHDNGSPPRFATSTAVVHITIQRRTNISYTVQVNEESANVEALNLLGVDQDYRVSGATFSLISGNDDNLFLIDAANASLKVGSRPLDRELRREYRLQMQVEKDGIIRGIAMVTVQILDVNDNSPSFQGSIPYNSSIKEDAGIGTNVFNVLAKDSDSGLNGTVKYAITAGNDQGLFAIDNATGIITLAGSLDREKTSQFTLTIQAYDGGSPPMTNTTTVTINVQDVNDNSPVFNQTSISKTIPEWATNGTEVAVVSATDGDIGDNGRITYVIQEGADGKFAINPNSGGITTTGGLTTTTKARYTLTVIAYDNGSPPRSATAVVHITIQRRTNISYTDQVREGSVNVEVLSLLGVDQDYRVSGATFSLISGNDDNLFLIDAANKVLKVGSRPLDRELRSEYRLQMQVEKDGITRGIATVTVLVLDVNDNTPSFQGSIPYDKSIKEDAGIGTSVFKVLAKDSDSGLNGTVNYNITAGNDQGLFAIDNATGIITLAGSLDREKTAQFTLTIQAYDGGSPPMTNTTTVTINVQDVNDNSPVLNQTIFAKTISEWATNGTEVVVVSATDADSGDNSRITYAIQEGADGKFVIDPNSGVITTTGGLSHSTKPTYTIIVKAKDHGSSPRSSTAVVSVIVEPKTNRTYRVQVTENRPNEIVMNLLVVEQDYNATGANLSISSGNSDGHFEINDATKDLKVTSNPLDREIKDEYKLRVTLAKDGKVRGVAMIVVNVLDLNDNSPAFQSSTPYKVGVKEDLDVGKSIFKVTATDGDSGANGTVRYNITEGNEEGFFSIDNNTGDISLSKSLDRETTAQYNLTIQAYDGGSPPMTNTTTVTINVLDVNDNSPVFTSRVTNVTISEDTEDGVQIAQVIANDLDSGVNSKIDYSIVGGDYGKFKINKTTGAITKIGGLSAKERHKFTLIIVAEDNGKSPRSGTALVYITVTRSGVNQYSPVFTKNEYLGGVYKDTSDNQVILTVSATDADSQANGEVVYELTDNALKYFFHLQPVSGRLLSANSFLGKEGELFILKAVAKDKGTPPKNSTNANLCVFVLRDCHSMVITAGVDQDFILKRIDEFQGVLDDLTGGKAFIKSVRPKEGSKEWSEIIVNVVKNKKEQTSAEIEDSMKQKDDDIKSKYSKWKIRTFEPPTTAKRISSGGLSAIVGAMICLALLIGVGGIIMIIILIKKRREREIIRKKARVTFSDEPHYINIDGSQPVSRLRHVESAQEAQEGLVNGDETSSVGSEEVQTTPDPMDYLNEAYNNDEHDEENGFVNNSDRADFGTFFPPPPTEPPPPVPDSDAGSQTSEEETINSDEEEREPDYSHVVLPPHEDFADNPTPQIPEENNGDSPNHSHSDSTSQLIDPSSYEETLLHDSTGFGALRRSSNPELTTEL